MAGILAFFLLAALICRRVCLGSGNFGLLRLLPGTAVAAYPASGFVRFLADDLQ